MLIINADDLGCSREATDRILACHKGGRITSASAMVFMQDSKRAAELALSAGLEVGLHLNLSAPFTDDSAPMPIAAYQRQICRFLTASKYALLFFHPLLLRQFRQVVDAQAGEFKRLYGRAPSHWDGHQHLHMASNVLLSNLLPQGARVRRSFSFRPGEKSLANRLYRAAVDRRLARRHRLTDYFFALAQNLNPVRLAGVLQLAREANVELMTHPFVQREYDFLLGGEFGRALSGVRLAGYEAL